MCLFQTGKQFANAWIGSSIRLYSRQEQYMHKTRAIREKVWRLLLHRRHLQENHCFTTNAKSTSTKGYKVACTLHIWKFMAVHKLHDMNFEARLNFVNCYLHGVHHAEMVPSLFCSAWMLCLNSVNISLICDNSVTTTTVSQLQQCHNYSSVTTTTVSQLQQCHYNSVTTQNLWNFRRKL
jgi:hypothetical protein